MMNGDDDEVYTHEIEVIRICLRIIMATLVLEYLTIERYLFEFLPKNFLPFDLY